ncbi:MAG: helix-turn-helix transcriptional regulator [Bacteroidales bacterium]|nr:helix-turn-helix transcriptional regulator [Bacteroidales bacterium]
MKALFADWKANKYLQNKILNNVAIDVQSMEMYVACNDLKMAHRCADSINVYIQAFPLTFVLRYKMVLMQLYAREKNYTKAAQLADTLAQRCQLIGDIDTWLSILKDHFVFLCKAGQGEVAINAFDTYIAAKDSFDIATANAKLDELRTQYDVDRLELTQQRQRYVIIGISIIAVLLLLLFVLYYTYNQRIKRKNQIILSQTIDNIRHDLEINPQNIQQFTENEILTEGNDLQELFDNLNKLMVTTSCYLKQDISRKEVALQLNINETKLYKVLREMAEMTFSEYITSLRLEHVKNTISNSLSDSKIDAIALESGFKSRTTFYRCFKDRYGISPSELRKKQC